MIRNKKGQSTLEYVILVTAVIVVIISLLVSPTSPFKQKLNSTINSAIEGMDTMAQRLDASHTSK
ncbi:MAG: class III signal peptide-containing protein [Candidatus Omnitrophica bacterium]|nr:class III signal peptide-containing protein [Candidatus Omnitrophota bacterium]